MFQGLFSAWREEEQKQAQVSDSAMVGLLRLDVAVGTGFAGAAAAHHE